MAQIPVHPSSKPGRDVEHANPLPKLLQTPSGLAILELQGRINLPSLQDEVIAASIASDGNASHSDTITEFPIGRLIFPDYDPDNADPNNTAWMKRVYFYVGKTQRLTGEVKKLPKAFGVLRKRYADPRRGNDDSDAGNEAQEVENNPIEELEVLDIVKYKILFSQRPEPVGSSSVET